MPNQFEPTRRELLNRIGGEPLEGSGFEHEQPEDNFNDGGDDDNK